MLQRHTSCVGGGTPSRHPITPPECQILRQSAVRQGRAGPSFGPGLGSDRAWAGTVCTRSSMNEQKRMGSRRDAGPGFRVAVQRAVLLRATLLGVASSRGCSREREGGSLPFASLAATPPPELFGRAVCAAHRDSIKLSCQSELKWLIDLCI